MNSNNRDNGNKELRSASFLMNDRALDATENMQTDGFSEFLHDDTPIMSPMYMCSAFQYEYGV